MSLDVVSAGEPATIAVDPYLRADDGHDVTSWDYLIHLIKSEASKPFAVISRFSWQSYHLLEKFRCRKSTRDRRTKCPDTNYVLPIGK